VNTLLKKEKEAAQRTALAQFDSEKAQLLQQLEEAEELRAVAKSQTPKFRRGRL
jgi:hypothetical protein